MLYFVLNRMDGSLFFNKNYSIPLIICVYFSFHAQIYRSFFYKPQTCINNDTNTHLIEISNYQTNERKKNEQNKNHFDNSDEWSNKTITSTSQVRQINDTDGNWKTRAPLVNKNLSIIPRWGWKSLNYVYFSSEHVRHQYENTSSNYIEIVCNTRDSIRIRGGEYLVKSLFDWLKLQVLVMIEAVLLDRFDNVNKSCVTIKWKKWGNKNE